MGYRKIRLLLLGLLIAQVPAVRAFVQQRAPLTNFRMNREQRKRQQIRLPPLNSLGGGKKIVRQQRIASQNQQVGEQSSNSISPPVRAVFVAAWIAALSAFLFLNYSGSTSWPEQLTDVPLRVWSLLHALNGLLFAGTILTTTVLEGIIVQRADDPVKQFWFENTVDRAETVMVLPGLTGLIVSGTAQMWMSYEVPLAQAPQHIQLPLQILAAFALWWWFTDLRWRGAEAATDEAVQRKRLWSNVVSCLFLFVIGGVMVLKPGYEELTRDIGPPLPFLALL